jgi:hypothetical protein
MRHCLYSSAGFSIVLMHNTRVQGLEFKGQLAAAVEAAGAAGASNTAHLARV